MNTYTALTTLLLSASLLAPAYAKNTTSIETDIWSNQQKHCINSKFSDGEIVNYGCVTSEVIDEMTIKEESRKEKNLTIRTYFEGITINKNTQIVKGGFSGRLVSKSDKGTKMNALSVSTHDSLLFGNLSTPFGLTR